VEAGATSLEVIDVRDRRVWRLRGVPAHRDLSSQQP
jgi:hypothetical protein